MYSNQHTREEFLVNFLPAILIALGEEGESAEEKARRTQHGTLSLYKWK